MTKAEFLQHIKNHMKNNKNSWINQYFFVDGHKIGLKLYTGTKTTTINRLEIDGLMTPSFYDLTQKKVLETIDEYMTRS